MAAKAPVWEICKSTGPQPFWARLRGKNGRKIATTETYKSKQSVKNALKVANPGGAYEVRDNTI